MQGLTRAVQGARESRLTWLVGAGVVLAYVVLHITFLPGPHPYDPSRYFDMAERFPNVRPDLWSLRIGVLFTVSAAVGMFGPSAAVLFGVPLAFGMLLTAAVFATVVTLFHHRTAAAAAALVTALNASYFLNASQIFPDSMSTATFAAAYLFVILSAQRYAARQQRPADVFAVLAGTLLGLSYLIREFTPMLFPMVGGALLLLRFPRRGLALFSLSAFAMFCLELLYGLVRYGQPFIHLRMLLARSDRGRTPGTLERMQHILGQVDTPLDAMLVLPRLITFWRSGWFLVVLIAVFLVGLVRFRSDRRLQLLAIWGVGYWLLMVILALIPPPSGPWIVNVTNIRYWAPVFPPLIMGAFGTIALLVQQRVRTRRSHRLSSTMAVAAALLVLVPGLAEYSICQRADSRADIWRAEPPDRWQELRSWFASGGADGYSTLRTDRRTSKMVPAFTSTRLGRPLWEGNVADLPRDPSSAEFASDPSLVLVHRDHFPSSKVAPGLKAALQEGWVSVFETDDSRIAVLAPRETAGEGEVPDLRTAQSAGLDVSGCGMNAYEPPWRRPRP